MSLFKELSLDDLTPAVLWARLPTETRRLAADAVYRGGAGQAAARAESDHAIAAAIRFRGATVRKLPVERRITYLLRNVSPDSSLASSLLLALHLVHRVPVLETFLEGLDIPQENGLIDESYDLQPPEPARLAAAVHGLFDKLPQQRSEIEVYLATLLAMDPDTWGGLSGLLHERTAG